MEEKVLIKSELFNIKKTIRTLLILGVFMSIIMVFIFTAKYQRSYAKYYTESAIHKAREYCYDYKFEKTQSYVDCYSCEIADSHSNQTLHALSIALEEDWYFYLIPVTALSIFSVLLYLALRNSELTVTDKRIYGVVAWGKRVDLPLDSISATSTKKFLKTLSVSTSSGFIRFRLVKNYDEIYNIINNLLINRQQKPTAPATITQEPKTDSIDQLRKYKDLLDDGIITQEEFDAKKKQLLDL